MKSVLIVDDNEIDTFLNKKILERVQQIREIHCANNGKAAIDLLIAYFERSKSLPDIILLDLNMPIMNGFLFIEKFYELQVPGKEEVNIIIVTSSSSPSDLEAIKQKGINLYLLKPLTEEKFLRALGMENSFWT